jgi:hypothetical protein
VWLDYIAVSQLNGGFLGILIKEIPFGGWVLGHE